MVRTASSGCGVDDVAATPLYALCFFGEMVCQFLNTDIAPVQCQLKWWNTPSCLFLMMWGGGSARPTHKNSVTPCHAMGPKLKPESNPGEFPWGPIQWCFTVCQWGFNGNRERHIQLQHGVVHQLHFTVNRGPQSMFFLVQQSDHEGRIFKWSSWTLCGDPCTNKIWSVTTANEPTECSVFAGTTCDLFSERMVTDIELA